jgi:hypothetical protein
MFDVEKTSPASFRVRPLRASAPDEGQAIQIYSGGDDVLAYPANGGRDFCEELSRFYADYLRLLVKEQGASCLERALAAKCDVGGTWFTAFKDALRVARLEIEVVEQAADGERVVVQRFTVEVAYTDVMHLLKFSAFLVSGTGSATSFDYTSAFGGRLADAHRRITEVRDTALSAATMPREPGRNGTFDTFEFPYPTQPEDHNPWHSSTPPNKNCLSF